MHLGKLLMAREEVSDEEEEKEKNKKTKTGQLPRPPNSVVQETPNLIFSPLFAPFFLSFFVSLIPSFTRRYSLF